MTKQEVQEYVDELETTIAEAYEAIRNHDLSRILVSSASVSNPRMRNDS